MGNNQEKKLKNILVEKIGIGSFLITSVTFLLRGMWYFYYCGYFKAFNIDKSLLSINNDASLYSTLGLIGIAIFLCALNYWIYEVWVYKKWGCLVFTIFAEVFAMFVAICWMSNIGLKEIWACTQNTGWQGLEYISVRCLWCVFFINIYAIIFYVVFRIFNKKTSTSTETFSDKLKKFWDAEDDKKIAYVLYFVAGVTLVSVLWGILVFVTGSNDANKKKDFRIIEEVYLTENHAVDDKYLFQENGQLPKQYYAVLYELEDKYVVASLALEKGSVVKDLNKQKVISKDNVITYYYADLDNDFWNKDEKQKSEADVKNNKTHNEGEENSSMAETFRGALIGALAAGLCNFFIERRNRKNRGERHNKCKFRVKYKKNTYVVNLSDKIRIDWIKFVLLIKRIKRRVLSFIPKNMLLYVVLTIFWMLFAIFIYYVGGKYKSPAPYAVKDVLWELKNSYFTSVVLALLIAGYSQNADYKKNLHMQHNLYVDTMSAFEKLYEQFIGEELCYYMPFYNEECLSDTSQYIQNTISVQCSFYTKEFKGNVDEVLDGIYQVENEVRNMIVLGMHKDDLVCHLQSAKQSLKKSLRQKLDLKKALEVINEVEYSLFYIVADLRRPWRWDIENDIKILRLLEKYEENGIQNHFYYGMHLYGHKFK